MKKLITLFYAALLALNVNAQSTCASAYFAKSDDVCELEDITIVAGDTAAWISFVADSNWMNIEIGAATNSPQAGVYRMELYSGTCNALTLIAINDTNNGVVEGNNTLNMIYGSLTIGNTYYMRVIKSAITAYDEYFGLCIVKLPNYTIGNNCTIQCQACDSDLICNGGFECKTANPSTLGQIPFPTTSWYNPGVGFGTPDYFHTLGTTPSLQVPVNFYGNQTSLMGLDAYVSLNTYGAGSFREYLQQQLINPMKPGVIYYACMYVSLVEKCKFANSNFGMHFTNAPVNQTSTTNIPVSPTVEYTGAPITNTAGWTRINGCVMGNNQQYITIGNFRADNSTTNTIANSTPITALNNHGMYYFDSVSVVRLADAGHDTLFCIIPDTVILGPSCPIPGASYSWAPANGLSCVNCPNPIAYDTVSHNYVVHVTVPTNTGNSCVARDTVKYEIKLRFDLKGIKSTCYGDSALFYLTNCSTDTNVIYSWTSQHSIIYNPQDTCAVYINLISAQNTGDTIIVYATDTVTGCTHSDTLFIDKCCTQIPQPNCTNPNFYNYPVYNASQINTDCPGFGVNQNGYYSIPTKTFSINGTFVVDANVSFNDCRILLGPNAKIIIQPGDTLKIEHSHLYGCDPMWDGIFIQSNTAKLICSGNAKGSTLIEDADSAVVSISGGIYTIDQTTFNKNWKGIVVIGTNGPHKGRVRNSVFTSRTIPFGDGNYIINIKQTITTSNAYPVTTLMAPHALQRTHTGIELLLVNNFTPIVIGSPASMQLYNLFDVVGCGVHGIFSNVNVINNFFRRITPFANGPAVFAGVWAEAGAILNVQISNTFRVGDNPTYSRNRFEDCRNGIYADKNINLFARRNTFDGTLFCIDVRNAKNNNTVDIRHNTLTNFAVGIRGVQNFKCNFNVFADTLDAQPNTTATGLWLQEITNTNTTAFYNIHHNVIRSVIAGIRAQNLNKANLSFNSIRIRPTLPLYSYGMQITANLGTIVSNNNIRSFPASNNDRVGGIYASISSQSFITCNNLENMGYAIRCEGTMVSDIFNNTMQNCKTGFWLSNNGLVGPQDFPTFALGQYGSYNKWIGNFINHTYTSGPIATDGSNSPFYCRNVNLQEYPNPFLNNNAGGGNVSIQVIFPSSNGPTNPPNCSTAPPALVLNNLAHIIALNQINFGANDSNASWNNRQTLFHNIFADSIDVSNDTILNNFYNMHGNLPMGKLARINRWLAKQSADIDSLYIENNLIATNNTIEQNHKDVLNVYFNFLTNNSYNTTDSVFLNTIANKCPFTDGIAVYQARTLLSFIQNYPIDYVDNCFPESNERSNKTAITLEPDGLIFPNPAGDNITLKYATDNRTIMIMYNSMGQKVKTVNLQQGEYHVIDITELDNGVYYYMLNDEKEIIVKGKFVILK